MTKNKQTFKKINYFFLICTTLASNIQASDNSLENLKSSSAVKTYFISKEEPNLTFREMRLELFGLDKFESSFDLSSDVLVQMKNRNKIWKQPNSNSYIREEIMRYIPTQNKILNYIPHYFRKILDVESVEDLKVKGEYFSDFINLMGTLHRNLKGSKQMKKLEEKLLDIDFKQYPLSSIFFRYLALKKDNFLYADYPFFMQQKIDSLRLDDQFDKPYNYHKSLKENCKMDQDQLEEIAKLEDLSKEDLKAHIDDYHKQFFSDYR